LVAIDLNLAAVLTDTHCHLDFNHYEHDRPFVLNRAWETGLERIMVPGVDLVSSQAAIKVARGDHRIFAAVGVHPNSSLTWNGTIHDAILRLTHHPKVVAIGEIGLDYYRDRAPRSHQKQVFKELLDLAKRRTLPVIIHTRNASADDRRCITDLIEILSEWTPNLEYPGVIHSYSGNIAEAEELIEMGYFLGITGPITYKSAASLREVVESSPLERLLIETDGPFLTPHPHRGKRNEPAYVRYIAEKISEVHHCSVKTVIKQTSLNAQVLFRWKEAERA
jgi:TatD DNase family protein